MFPQQCLLVCPELKIDNEKEKISVLTAKCIEIEASQTFLSKEYDNFTNTLQTVKQDVLELANCLKAAEEELQTMILLMNKR